MPKIDTSLSMPTGIRAVPDALADFGTERPTPVRLVATPPTPRARDTRAMSVASVACPPPGAASDTSRIVWAFALGVICGAILGALLLDRLAPAASPLPDLFAHAARTVVDYSSTLSGMLQR